MNFRECHSINTKKNFKIKNTQGDEIIGPFNKNIDLSVIQLNHYKSKTLQEFKFVRQRGRAGLNNKKQKKENVISNFKIYDKNEVEDLTAYNFYKKFIKN